MSEYENKQEENSLTITFNEKFNCYVVVDCNKKATEVIIPNTYNDEVNGEKKVAYIVERAFMDCKNLKSVVIPKSIKAIGDKAFVRCYSLEVVHIGDSLERIGHQAFRRCGNIKEFDLPVSVLEIENDAFKDSSIVARRAYKNWLKNYAMRAFCLEN